MARGDDRDAADAVPERARTLLNRHFGADTRFVSSRIEGHEVWRVRHRETGETVVVKFGANASTARAMADSGVAARMLAADDAARICVMEDVGATTLADILAASDAQAATQGLLSLARTLGALHGWSSAREPTQSRLAPMPPLPLAAFMNICGALGVDADRARVELIAAEHCMHSEDPQVIVHGDPCPENFVPGPPDADTGKFVDFEVAHRGNAILEATCWRMPFPTCWRVARMPHELQPHMDASYAAGFTARSPQRLDTATLPRLQAAACVYWLVWCLTGKRFLEANDERFAGPGFASVRERGLLWLDNAAATIARAGHFERTGDVARGLAERLRQRWEPVSDAPSFPAFLS